MKYKGIGNPARYGIMAALFLLLVFPAHASMVSFLVVETGLSDEAASSQYSSLWEGGLMSVFFDAGHIVTNYPVARMDKKPAVDLSGYIGIEFNEAAENGSEYFVLVFLEYQTQGRSALPTESILKLYRTDTKELIFEQSFPAGSARTLNEEYQLAQNAGRLILSNIKDR